MNDAMGDRLKQYEDDSRFMPFLLVIARLDGKNFRNFTKGLARPFDKRLSDLMINTTAYLVEDTNAACGYTQSDEITLAYYSKSQIYFDGRIQKMVSVLAAACSVYFNTMKPAYLTTDKLAMFDCRVYAVPTLEEGANVFLWREFDATKNSITMAAQECYSHKELMHKNGSDKQEMLFQKGINWNDYPDFFKRGSYIQRRVVKSKVTNLDDLPPKHAARKNPDLEFERTEYNRINMPPFNKVTNRVGVIFNGEEPNESTRTVDS